MEVLAHQGKDQVLMWNPKSSSGPHWSLCRGQHWAESSKHHGLQWMAVLSPFLPLPSPAATGLFKYQVKGARISYQGLSILYCVSILCPCDGFWMKAEAYLKAQNRSEGWDKPATILPQTPTLLILAQSPRHPLQRLSVCPWAGQLHVQVQWTSLRGNTTKTTIS
jgi:hypothetical protein